MKPSQSVNVRAKIFVCKTSKTKELANYIKLPHIQYITCLSLSNQFHDNLNSV